MWDRNYLIFLFEILIDHLLFNDLIAFTLFDKKATKICEPNCDPYEEKKIQFNTKKK